MDDLNPYSETIAKVLGKTFGAINDGFTTFPREVGTDIFFALLRYHGMTVVSTCSLVAEWDEEDGPAKIVGFDNSEIQIPKYKAPLTPEQARGLGEALIAASHYARIEADRVD
jgi:hypothetical protein